MKQWTIYCRPSDYPGNYVVREWLIEPGAALPGEVIALVESLEQARDAVLDAAPGAYCLGKDPEDDPAIVEVWL